MTFQQARICRGCWQQLHLPVPLRGVASLPFPPFRHSSEPDEPQHLHGLRADVHAGDEARKVSIDATILFADLRGYTSLSQSQSPDAVSGLLDAFYDECADAIWEYDGLLNKTMGDAVMAVFNFPIRRDDHTRQALLAARTSSGAGARGTRRWSKRRAPSVGIGVGIGINSAR